MCSGEQRRGRRGEGVRVCRGEREDGEEKRGEDIFL